MKIKIRFIAFSLLLASMFIACRNTKTGQGSDTTVADTTEMTEFFDTQAAEQAAQKAEKKSDRPKNREIPAEREGRPDVQRVRDGYYVS